MSKSVTPRISPPPPAVAAASQSQRGKSKVWLAKAAIVTASVSMTLGGWVALVANEPPTAANTASAIAPVALAAQTVTQPTAASTATASTLAAPAAMAQSPKPAAPLRVVTVPVAAAPRVAAPIGMAPRPRVITITRSSK